ncbi:hypothetical protein BDA99DRAFT_568084 [Phascolomyces articulosus]|uniref:Uncharacterized protein n=1 Tax=Phascolomyces articulosus TaxID=60185 RepID=A0AAD5KBH7_9FUNG|nr:hypothetical protein BDA99DRAFT_568084 [Phascolomyces articulosus]
MTLTISKSPSTTSPSPQRSKSLQLHDHASLPTSKKQAGKKKLAEHHKSVSTKRQSRSDSELSKSTTTTSTMLRTPQRRRRSNSAAVVRSNYAGPVFNNAPEPSSLPLPTFLSPQHHHPHPLHHHHRQQQQHYLSPSNSGQLPQRPRTVSFHTIDEHRPVYFPTKMATAHPPQSSDPTLIELQQRLCSVLKLVIRNFKYIVQRSISKEKRSTNKGKPFLSYAALQVMVLFI